MIRQLLSQCLFWERTHFPSISHYSQSILRILPSDILGMFQMGTTDAISIVRQLQEKYIAAKKLLYFALVNLEKAFDRVPRWALRSLRVEECAVLVIQGMYSNARSQVRVNGQYSEEFSFSTLMTWCYSRTTKRSVSPSSRCGRLAWKINGSMST